MDQRQRLPGEIDSRSAGEKEQNHGPSGMGRWKEAAERRKEMAVEDAGGDVEMEGRRRADETERLTAPDDDREGGAVLCGIVQCCRAECGEGGATSEQTSTG